MPIVPLLLTILAVVLVAPLVALVVMRTRAHRGIRRAREHLLARVPSSAEPFSDRHLEGLPEPVRRYFRHAIAPGTPLAWGMELDVTMRVRRDKTDPRSPHASYRLDELLTPIGLVGDGWEVGIRTANRTTFWYADGKGESREAHFDLVPAVLASGDTIARLLRSRVIHELIWAPSVLLPRDGIEWRALDERTIEVTVEVEGDRGSLRLEIDEDGRLLQVSGPRWGAVGTRERQFIPMGVRVEDETTFDGYTIPTHLVGGWWWGTDRYIETMEFEVHDARRVASGRSVQS